MRLELRVHLKTVDLVRETAWLALTESLGWAGSLRDLKRYDLWRFDGEGPDRSAFIAALDRELERSSTFYNPNKEGRVWLEEGSLAEGERLESAAALPVGEVAAGSIWRAFLWVTDEGGARPDVVTGCRARLAADGIRLANLRMGNLWTVELSAEDESRARGLLAGLALSRSRREGLLANPHYQEVHLLALTEDRS